MTGSKISSPPLESVTSGAGAFAWLGAPRTLLSASAQRRAHFPRLVYKRPDSKLHAPALLNNLRHRFALDPIYTYTGKICIAVNPFNWAVSKPLYAEDAMYRRMLKEAGPLRRPRQARPPSGRRCGVRGTAG